MNVSLPIKSFAFFKVALGGVFLVLSVAFQNVLNPLFLILPLMVGKAHTIGAWVAMWKSNKLNWKYVSFITLYVIVFLYLGLMVWTLDFLLIITNILFAFHFLFDEFDLQEETKNLANLILPTAIFIQLVMYMFNYFNILHASFSVYLGITLLAVLLETVFLKEISWQYINIKLIAGFLLYCVYAGTGPVFVFSTILIFHYLFWFIYPVYKVHKYKREERDGLIMILIILVLTSIYVVWGINSSMETRPGDMYNFPLRYFLIFTIVHVLATAPFAYLIGLPRPKFH